MKNPIFLSYKLSAISCKALIHKALRLFVCLCFTLTAYDLQLTAHAQEIHLPNPGVMVHLSPEFNPAILKGIKVHPDNPFKFEFILDKGEAFTNLRSSETARLKEEANRLIRYFLASVTTPEKDLWVNLSPYERDRIIPTSFGLTEMGRDLLAQDYMLKQITASLIYPEDQVGKRFWKRIYEEAAKKYGNTNIPVNTFNKVWIVPEKAVVYENAKAGTAYVVESRLKVMLEEDYLSTQKHNVGAGFTPAQNRDGVKPSPTVNGLGSQIIREIVIPELTKEINEGKNFSQLRQVYNSLILAQWYKKKIKDSILAKVYADKNKVKGLSFGDSPLENNVKGAVPMTQEARALTTDKIYQQYIQAFKKGVYNYIKDEIDPLTQTSTARKYFSGGVSFGRDTTMTGITDMMQQATAQQAVSVVEDLERRGALQLTVDAAVLTNLEKAPLDMRLSGFKIATELDHSGLEPGSDEFVVDGKKYQFHNFMANKLGTYMYSLGPLVFLVAQKLDKFFVEGKKVDVNQVLQVLHNTHHSKAEGYQALYTDHISNMIYIPPISAIEEHPLNLYTSLMIGAMLSHQKDIHNSIVYDFGAGSGILALIALKMGARKVVLIESDDRQSAMSEAMLQFYGYQAGVDYEVIPYNMKYENKEAFLAQLKKIETNGLRKVSLVNMGSWYKEANRIAVDISIALGVDKIFNGGYLAGNKDMAGNEDIIGRIKGSMKRGGYVSRRINEFNSSAHEGISMIIADKAMASIPISQWAPEAVNQEVEKFSDPRTWPEHHSEGNPLFPVKGQAEFPFKVQSALSLERLDQIWEEIERFIDPKDMIEIEKFSSNEGKTSGFLRFLNEKYIRKFNVLNDLAGYWTRPRAIVKRLLNLKGADIESWSPANEKMLQDAYLFEYWIYHATHHFEQVAINRHELGNKLTPIDDNLRTIALALDDIPNDIPNIEIIRDKFAHIQSLWQGIQQDYNNFKSPSPRDYQVYFSFLLLYIPTFIEEWKDFYNKGKVLDSLSQSENFDEIKSNMASVEQFLEAAQYLIRDIGRYGAERLDKIHKEPTNLSKIINIAENTAKFLGMTVEIDGLEALQEGDYLLDATKLIEVFDNLVINASQAARPGTKPKVKIRTKIVNKAQKKFVEIEVEDNGSGISPENLRRMFTPRFTTKSSASPDLGVVHGVGVSLSRQIIIGHDSENDMSVRNNENTPGVTFTILLKLDQALQVKSPNSVLVQRIEQKETGGIDLTSDKALQVNNAGDGISFKLDESMLARLQNSAGFYPVITNIEPISDLKGFLGLNPMV